MTSRGSIWGGLIAASLMLSGCGVEGSSEGAATAAPANRDPSAQVEEGPSLTGPQRNAVRSARNYLSMTGFSRAGLIDQLSSEYGEGYTKEDATIAVDSLDADWNANAVRSAEKYLEMTGFSCNGLVEQLSSSHGDQYTEAQARVGAQQAGAC